MASFRVALLEQLCLVEHNGRKGHSRQHRLLNDEGHRGASLQARRLHVSGLHGSLGLSSIGPPLGPPVRVEMAGAQPHVGRKMFGDIFVEARRGVNLSGGLNHTDVRARASAPAARVKADHCVPDIVLRHTHQGRGEALQMRPHSTQEKPPHAGEVHDREEHRCRNPHDEDHEEDASKVQVERPRLPSAMHHSMVDVDRCSRLGRGSHGGVILSVHSTGLVGPLGGAREPRDRLPQPMRSARFQGEHAVKLEQLLVPTVVGDVEDVGGRDTGNEGNDQQQEDLPRTGVSVARGAGHPLRGEGHVGRAPLVHRRYDCRQDEDRARFERHRLPRGRLIGAERLGGVDEAVNLVHDERVEPERSRNHERRDEHLPLAHREAASEPAVVEVGPAGDPAEEAAQEVREGDEDEVDVEGRRPRLRACDHSRNQRSRGDHREEAR
eukprot:scaffold232271_cov23-Tisochrysis_lutea.AAC.1